MSMWTRQELLDAHLSERNGDGPSGGGQSAPLGSFDPMEGATEALIIALVTGMLIGVAFALMVTLARGRGGV